VIDKSEVRARLDAVVAAMKQTHAWEIERPRDEAFVDMGAFGMQTMAFEQWLKFVFVPNVEKLLESNGPWPEKSMVATQATREGDGNPLVAELVPSLRAFDALFEPPPSLIAPLPLPSRAAEPYERSRAAFARGEHQAALAAIAEALAIDPRFPNAHNYAGWILLHWPARTATQLESAITHFREALVIEPGTDAPLANACDALLAAGREEEAIAEAERARSSPEWNRAAAAENWLGWRGLARPETLDAAITHFRTALMRRWAWGVARSNLGKALEMKGDPDKAYEEHARALDCDDDFDRAFSHERRAAYEARHGWLRNAIYSFEQALKEDRKRGGGREATYTEAMTWLESQLQAQGVERKDATTPERWARAREREIPAGFNAKNEWGEPFADEVIEVERLLRDDRWADAVAAVDKLKRTDQNKLIDAIGYASWGAKRAWRAGAHDEAIAMQSLVVDAYVSYASGASSGAEGMGRIADVERERKKLAEWQKARSARA
jgi:uncharacterized protein YqcC (DUF446 family)/Tfp pilus assembly protein PilF